MSPINMTAVVTAAVVAFIVGFLLHGPLLGKLWMKLANIHPTGKEKLSDMWKQMVYNFIANLVTAFVLSGVLWIAFSSPFMGEMTALKGAICAFWIWLGFLATGSSMEVIWMGRSYKLWLFDTLASLAVLMSMGAVIAGW